MDSNDTIVQDAEIVEDVATQQSSQNQTATDVLLSLENLIKSHSVSIDKLTVSLKEQRAMLEDSFQNDPTYLEHTKLAKEAAKVKSQTKLEITKQPAIFALSQKVKELSADLKDKKLALSDYLREYQRLTQVNEIEVADGDVREIVTTPKLVKKSNK